MLHQCSCFFYPLPLSVGAADKFTCYWCLYASTDSLLQQVFAVRFLGSMAVRCGNNQEVIYEAMRQVLAARAIHNIFRTTESHLMVTSSNLRYKWSHLSAVWLLPLPEHKGCTWPLYLLQATLLQQITLSVYHFCIPVSFWVEVKLKNLRIIFSLAFSPCWKSVYCRSWSFSGTQTSAPWQKTISEHEETFHWVQGLYNGTEPSFLSSPQVDWPTDPSHQNKCKYFLHLKNIFSVFFEVKNFFPLIGLSLRNSSFSLLSQFQLGEVSQFAAHQENGRLMGFVVEGRDWGDEDEEGEPSFNAFVFESNTEGEKVHTPNICKWERNVSWCISGIYNSHSVCVSLQICYTISLAKDITEAKKVRKATRTHDSVHMKQKTDSNLCSTQLQHQLWWSEIQLASFFFQIITK